MSTSQSNHGKVIVADGCAFVYLSIEQMHARHRRRIFFAKARRYSLVALLAASVILAMVSYSRVQQREAVRRQDLQRLRQVVEPSQQALRNAVDGGLLKRFAPAALESWQRSESALENRLAALQSDPEDPVRLNLFRSQLRQTSGACSVSEGELKRALERQSRERCPQHPQWDRDPEARTCPYPPENHHLFNVWLSKGRYCWRDGRSTVCKRLTEIHLCD